MNPDVRRQEITDLMVRAQGGDRTALDELVRRLTPLVWNVARAQGVDRDTAMDVVQTVWLSLLQQLDRIRTPAALAGWLVLVARREARRVAILQRRQVPVESETLSTEDGCADVESAVIDGDQDRCLWRNVRKLSARCRELLRVIAYAERPDYEAISDALGMPKGSIGPTRGRCLAKLRTLLSEDAGWSDR